MKPILRNEGFLYNPLFPAGEELRQGLIDHQLGDLIERLDEKSRKQAYKRSLSRQNRREIRDARQRGANAPGIGDPCPPGAPFRAVIHDPRLQF